MNRIGRDKAIIGTAGVVLTVAGITGASGHSISWISGVNVMHDALHIVSGLFAVVMASKRGSVSVRSYGRAFGVIYALVAILGIIVGKDFPMNTSDTIPHLFLAVAFLFIGYREVIPHDANDDVVSPI
jgi:hypothetical protein